MKVSKGMFLGIMIGGLVIGVVLIVIGIGAAIMGTAAAGNNENSANVAAAGGMGIAFLGYACFFAVGVTYLVLLFKAWTAITDGQQRTTPILASLLMIIPLWQLYWQFVAVYGWSQDYNKYIARRGLTGAQPMNEQLFMFQCIAQIVCIVPFINFLAGPVLLVLLFINAAKMCDGINAIGAAPPQAMAATAR
jgi:hypothetical protein